MFDEVVGNAIKDSKLSTAVEYLEDNTTECMKDSKAIERLLNRTATCDEIDNIERILSALRKASFLFDSIDYTHGIRQLIKHE
jgi:hypothetical protein